MKKVTHILYTPFTGLGLYNGYRGRRWLKNRIEIFKKFVVPSLLAQKNRNFINWISWRYEDRNNPLVIELQKWLHENTNLIIVFTYSGVCFWDDKYDDEIARGRLIDALHGSMGVLLNFIGECDEVLMTIQPSDDCYSKHVTKGLRRVFEEIPALQAAGFKKGYVMNYQTKEIAEWNPTTTPPFFTIKFTRDVFIDPLKHVEYTGPYKSHEYIAQKLKFGIIDENREFLVGTHGENISTVFNHPFTGVRFTELERERILSEFGLDSVEPLKIKTSIRKAIMRKLPHGWQKKLRYWVGERFYSKIYEFLRS